MKRSVFFMFIGIVALGAMAQDGKFMVSGSLKGQGSIVYYALTDPSGGALYYDVKKLTDEKVDYSFDLDTVGYFFVFNQNRTLFMMPALPGENVIINGDVDNYTLDGSTFYREYSEATSALKPIQDAYWKYDFKQDCQDEIVGKNSEEVFELYQSRTSALYQNVTAAVFSYVGKHPDRESSMAILNTLDNVEDLKRAADMLTNEVRYGRMRPYYEYFVESCKKKGASNPLLNKPVPKLALKDIKDNVLKLNELKGKWVLLNFWSTTCGASTAHLMTLKNLHGKYKDQLEIVGVDCDDEESAWKSFVNVYALPWKNVIDPFNMDDANSKARTFGVTGLPTYFLISPSGKVVKTDINVNIFSALFKILFE